jgi:hypothetical protein
MSALDDYVLTTELDAVNILLGTIGEQPVSSLTEAGLTDVAVAKTVIAEQSRRLQAKGWDFNTDINYDLAQDVNNKVPIPVNALRIDTSDGSNLVQRAGFFWDRVNNTFVLTSAVKANIVRYLPFEDMPESARYYVALKAARIFQKRMLGDDSLEVFTEKDEFEAKSDFHDSEQSSAGRNMLREHEIFEMTRGGRQSDGAIDIV